MERMKRIKWMKEWKNGRNEWVNWNETKWNERNRNKCNETSEMKDMKEMRWNKMKWNELNWNGKHRPHYRDPRSHHNSKNRFRAQKCMFSPANPTLQNWYPLLLFPPANCYCRLCGWHGDKTDRLHLSVTRKFARSISFDHICLLARGEVSLHPNRKPNCHYSFARAERSLHGNAKRI